LELFGTQKRLFRKLFLIREFRKLFHSPRISVGLLIIIPLIFFSCGGQEDPELRLPPEQVLMARGTAILVTSLYARLHEVPDARSRVRYGLRLGEIGIIENASSGQSLVAQQLDYWYYVRIQEDEGTISGWIFGGDVEIHGNLARAQNAASQLLNAQAR
jgi:hypothetical protein